MKINFTEPWCSPEKPLGFLRRQKRLITFIMRVSLVNIFLITLSIQLLPAAPGNGQGLDEIYVSLDAKNESLKSILDKIQEKTRLRITYFDKQVEPYGSISLPMARRSVKETLERLLIGTGLTYRQDREVVYVMGAYLIIDEKEVTEPNAGSKKGFVDALLITGTVIEAKTNLPMAGVNIVVKGSTKGTTTNSDGKYSIDARDNDVLIFTFIGFKTSEILINGDSIIDVTMVEDASALQEVVINAGYWKVKKQEQTGNISRVTSDVIKTQPVSNPLAALQARVPGLEIIQQNGVPGGSFVVRIRGQNSIGNGNDPLYVVDGVPYISTTMSFVETSGEILNQSSSGAGGVSPLNYINPADIESIEILKDAAATAVYGSRGANGVILITTKKGQPEKTKIDVSFYKGVSRVAHFVDLQNTSQYLDMRREALQNDEGVPQPWDYDLLNWDTTRYTDWQRKLIGGTAQTIDAQMSVSGGDKITQFSFGGGYHKENTVFPGNHSDRRISTHISVSNTIPSQKLRTNVSINYSSSNTDLLANDLTPIAFELVPVAPMLYDENGELNWEQTPSGSATWKNPLSYLEREYEANTTNLIGNGVISYDLGKGLQIKTNLGFTNTQMKAITTTPKSFYDPMQGQSTQHKTYFSNSTLKNWIVEPQVNGQWVIGHGNLDVLVGTSFLEQMREGSAILGSGFSSEALMKNIGAASDRSSGTNYYSQYRYNAIFGRINYNVKGKYFMDVTGRRDGSSRFGTGKQFANFGAIGLAWIFSREGLIQENLPFISFGKLRSSYGTSGNDQIGDYQYLDTYTSGSVYMGKVGLKPVRLSNPNFAWEKNRKLELGLDLGFFEDRVLAVFSYYRNRSSNQLIGYSLPPNTGFTSIQSNFPAIVQNSGVELELQTTNLERSGLVWTTSLNFTFPRNKLLEFPDLEKSTEYADRLVVGEPLNIAKTYSYEGIDQQTGIYQFADKNNDGVLDFQDKQVVKTIGAMFYGALTNKLQYKGLEFDFVFQFVKQSDYDFRGSSAPGLGVQHTSIKERWQSEGDNSNNQRFTSTYNDAFIAYLNYAQSDRAIVDKSFIRLKNVSISYTLPQGWTSKLGMNNLRIFVLGQNLITFTDFKGLDPETQNGMLPPLRTVTAGLQISL